MSEKLKAFVVGCLGGGIGSLVALELAPYLWWVGLLLGGLVGYIGYDAKGAWQAFSRIFQREFWQEYESDLKGVLHFLVFAVLIALHVFAAILPWMLSEKVVTGDITELSLLGVLASVIVVSVLDLRRLGGDTLHFCFPLLGLALIKLGSADFQANMLLTRRRALLINPITIAVSIIPLTTVIVVWSAIRLVWSLAKVLCRAVPRTFVAIHCDARVIMALACTIGAATGYFSGSAAIGAGAGGMLGLLDLALLRQRVLALRKVPVQ